MQIKRENSLNQHGADAQVVALREGKLIHVEDLNDNRYLTNLLSLIRKEYALKSEKDAKFFEEHDIIDYSLLIGVIRKS